MSLPFRLIDLPKSRVDELMRYPNTWIAALLHTSPQNILQWRLRYGYKPATTPGGKHRQGRDEFFERWKGLGK